MNSRKVPIVDFSALSLTLADSELNEVTVKKTAEQLIDAFTTIGFVYLQNTAFPEDMLKAVFKIGQEFFDLPESQKRKYPFTKDENHGYVTMEQESVNPERPGDLKQCFDVSLCTLNDAKRWPSEITDFKRIAVDFFAVCSKLALRVLLAIAHGLEMKDVKFFDRCHNLMSVPSGTMLRLLMYPPLPEGIKADQVRLGEHSDYGSITLLFQDSIGGLQVKTRDGQWIEAVPVANAVLINVGDHMQRWTSDRLLSTPHRVLIPEEEIRQRTTRRSVAFFVHPDPDFVIECLDDSNKYPPTTDRQYLRQRLDATYLY
jgi:isopenicillin N synthase-like dioxygenase